MADNAISLPEYLSLISSDVQLLDKLDQLRKAADKACDTAFNDKELEDMPVNWADFDCVDSSIAIFDDGEWHWRVTVEEAAPHNTKLSEYLYREILKEFDNLGKFVEVICEW